MRCFQLPMLDEGEKIGNRDARIERMLKEKEEENEKENARK